MNDQDKHEMRLLQELYLEDEFGGSEKRKRNFRWRNIDENFNVGATNTDDNVNEEVDEADNYSELKERNLDLVERNKYLLELEEVEIRCFENRSHFVKKITTSFPNISSFLMFVFPKNKLRNKQCLLLQKIIHSTTVYFWIQTKFYQL